MASQSSLIKIFQFSERPSIVPPEVFSPYVVARALSPKMRNYLLYDQMIWIKHLFFLHYRPGYFQHFRSQLYFHFGFDAMLTSPTAKHSGKVANEIRVATGSYMSGLIKRIAQFAVSSFSLVGPSYVTEFY